MMPTSECIVVRAYTPDGIEQQLNAAVASVQIAAMVEGRWGIRVTRHEPTTFTVAVCPEVVYGQTVEYDELRACVTFS